MSIPILVQKFGGTSIATPEARQRVVSHVARAREDGYQVAVVLSAMGRRGDPYATDTLLDLLRAESEEVDPGDYDLMFSCGEAIATALVSQVLKKAGIPSIGLTSAQARIYTDGNHVEAEIIEVESSRLHSLMAADLVPVVTGCQGVARRTLDYTTLGRGGSDTSGVALGVALHASRVDIFTDVPGVATIDPRLVAGARILKKVSYASMYEMARYGARVVHPRALMTGWKGKTPMMVRSTFSEAPGTLIDDVRDESPLVGIAVLPPMHTLTLAPDSLDAERREDWERRHLVMSLADAKSGQLLVGASAEKFPGLRRALDAAGIAPTQSESTCCWLSMVGQPSAVRDRVPRTLGLFREQAIEVCGYEVTDRRCTFVIPEAARERAARLVYDDTFGA
jgi:aspartate kinase